MTDGNSTRVGQTPAPPLLHEAVGLEHEATASAGTHPAGEGHHAEHAGHPHHHSGAHSADRFNQSVLNRVMHGLRELITLRPGRSSSLQAQRDHAASGSHRPDGSPELLRGMVVRNGQVVPEEVLHRSSPTTPESAHETHRAHVPGTSSGTAHEDLTPFERAFIAHFENAAPLGEALNAGEFRFLGKTTKEWGEFFERLVPYTTDRQAQVADLEKVVFRGLLHTMAAEGGAERGTLISDLHFLNGKTDKFTRVEVQGDQGKKLLQELAEKIPGDPIAKALIAECVGDELNYRSLSHRVMNPEMVDSQKHSVAASYESPEKSREKAVGFSGSLATSGIALSARTEQIIADQLNIDLRQALFANQKRDMGNIHEKKQVRRKRWGILGGTEFLDEETGDVVFVPWYETLFSKERPLQKPKWYVALSYFTAASAIGLFLIFLIKYFFKT